MTERWLPVPGFEGAYCVSDQGRVRSLARIVILSAGNEMRIRNRVMKQQRAVSGHLALGLTHPDGRSERFQVHRLVAMAFLPEGAQSNRMVCHRDDVPDNNVVSNLYWGTQLMNMADRMRNKGHHYGNATHCKRGHEFTPENTHRRKDNGRTCRAYLRLSSQAIRDRRKQLKEELV